MFQSRQNELYLIIQVSIHICHFVFSYWKLIEGTSWKYINNMKEYIVNKILVKQGNNSSSHTDQRSASNDVLSVPAETGSAGFGGTS